MKELLTRIRRRLTVFLLAMLAVEFMDEVAYSALEAARPLIRDAFVLDYVQISLITTIPILVAILVEPIAGLYADGRHRRRLLVIGGIAFGAGLIVQGLAPSFGIFLLGATIQAPASGIFVNLAQASLMDDAPQRRENRMALWTFSGSLAVVTGPLLLTALLVTGQDWRLFFVSAGLLSIVLALSVIALPATDALRDGDDDAAEPLSLGERLRGAGALLRRGDVWRWLVLLEFSDLMLDVLFGLLALYLVDVSGATEAQAALAIAVWTGVGLVGDFLIIPLLERVRGLSYLRISAGLSLLLFPAFLLVEAWALKLVLLGLLGMLNAGWYAILQGKLYDTLGEQSGAVLIVGNAAGVFGALLPLGLGIVAEQISLTAAMWLLLAGPIALLIGLPHQQSGDSP